MTPMTQNERMAESHCKFTMSKYGCDECAKHCALADICKACDGDFSRSVGEDTIAADKAVQALERQEADSIANSGMVEYYQNAESDEQDAHGKHQESDGKGVSS